MPHACMCSLQVLLAWTQTSASADLAFSKEVFDSLLGLVSPSSMDALLKHSRSQRSSDAQPQSLGEQLYVNLDYLHLFRLSYVVMRLICFSVTNTQFYFRIHSRDKP